MKIPILENKRVVLGVTGSIAAYKAADLASKLTQVGAEVHVIMTADAKHFVAPLTFEAVTGNPVFDDLWQSSSRTMPTHIAHIGLAESADLILIAPATANTIAKIAHGLAHDLLSVTVLAARCPVVVAPAMDGGMYENPATQANLRILRERGITIIEPEWGRFASGLEGRGRLPETLTLIGEVRRLLGRDGVLAGRQVVVTAGGTIEDLDPVRYITNRSSGKQGFAVAQAALDAGASLTLITTVKSLPEPVGAEIVYVRSAAEMLNAVLKQADCDVLIMAAAVADFRPAAVASHKIKKQDTGLTVALEKNPDILFTVGQQRLQTNLPRVLIGFAAETDELIANAKAKLDKKNADMIVANDVSAPGAGFEGDTNVVTLITADAPPQTLEKMSKTDVAAAIIQWAAGKLTASAES
jgi:phosphopantothenoylcysteine decarboxylase/phosphopantothenate--cysteine ligase